MQKNTSEALFVVKEGWLTKQGGVFKTWKKRWFSIIGRELFYSKEQGVGEKGKIELNENVQIDIAPESKKNYAFKIHTPNRIYVVYAESDEARKSWMDAINSVIKGTDQEVQITLSDISISNVIDENDEHKILLVTRKQDPSRNYIMKSYPKTKNEKLLQDQLEMRSAFLKKRPCYIVPINFIIQSDTEISIVSQNMTAESLKNRLEKSYKFAEHIAKIYIAQIIYGLEELHKHRIIYSDLTISNILIDHKGFVAITDPGIKDSGRNLKINEYTAPELISDKEEIQVSAISEHNDWYCVGVILYEMICGLPPFWDQEKTQLIQQIKTQKLMFPHHVSKLAKMLIKKLMERNVSQRLGSGELGVEEIKRDPFFASLNWDSIASQNHKAPLD